MTTNTGVTAGPSAASSSSAFRKRVAIAVALAMVAVGLASTGSVAASVPTPTDVRDLLPTCAGLDQEGPFTDLAGLSEQTVEAVNCLASYRITRGRGGRSYAARDPVLRYEMAIFLVRHITYIEAHDTVGVEFGVDPSDAGFLDLGRLSPEAVEAINVLANLGIAQGKSSRSYDPYGPVSRRDMASFINRIQNAIDEQELGARYNFAGGRGLFDDVPLEMPRSDDISALAYVGIVQGKAPRAYEPYSEVQRSEMALYILRHLNENVRSERVTSQATQEDRWAPDLRFVYLPSPGRMTATFIASEDLDPKTVGVEDFTTTSAARIDAVFVTHGTTVTVRFDQPLDFEDEVGVKAYSIEDLAGNDGPLGDYSRRIGGFFFPAPSPPLPGTPSGRP